MNSLLKQKVLLGVIVNGAYLLFCLGSPSPYRPPRAYSPPSPEGRELAAPVRELPYVPLPPPAKASKAKTFYVHASNQLLVYLTNDLTLVRRHGHRLSLSPTFSVKNQSREAPRSVLLRFVSFSREQFFSEDTPLVITADGALKWPHGWGDERSGESPQQPGNKLPYSVEAGEDGGVVETLGTEIPYEDFIEIISARRVIVSLGRDRVELTADQIEALRDMHRQLPQPPPPAEENVRY